MEVVHSPPASAQMDYTDAEKNALEVVVVTSCFLSMIGASLIIVSFFAFKDVRVQSRKLLVFLSCADLVTATGNACGILFRVHGTGCIVQSAFTTASSVSSFFWTISIAVYLLYPDRTTFWYHLFSWGLPLLLVSIALGYQALGADEYSITIGWCWIRSDVDHALFWQLFTGKAWEIASYVAVTVLYILIKRKIYREIHDESEHLITRSAINALKEADRKLTWIPVLFVLVRIWGTVRFVLNHVGVTSQLFWLAVMQGAGDSAQGAVNCLLFVFLTKKTRKRFFGLCKRRSVELEDEAGGGGGAAAVGKEWASYSSVNQQGRRMYHP